MANARLPPDALSAAREEALLHPGSASAVLRHGEALLDAERLPEAIGEIQRALRLDHESCDARFALGRAWMAAGEPEKALEAIARVEEDHPGRAEMVERARAVAALPRCDPNYVRHLFDQFAADYDARMTGTLSYRAPQILREMFDFVMPGRAELDVLDLGCGTGLTGAVFRDVARRLGGIDLSPAMVEKARARKIYDALAVGDVETVLGAGGRDTDLILAADTLVYLGDLAAIFTQAAARLRPGGFFLFTVESKPGEGFALGPKRRWRHAQSYLRGEASQAGLEVAGLLEGAPRSEAGAAVEGFAVALTSPV